MDGAAAIGFFGISPNIVKALAPVADKQQCHRNKENHEAGAILHTSFTALLHPRRGALERSGNAPLRGIVRSHSRCLRDIADKQ